VVVETIDFYDDEDDELPPPMSLKELVAFNKQQALREGAEGQEEEEAAGADADMTEVGVRGKEGAGGRKEGVLQKALGGGGGSRGWCC